MNKFIILNYIELLLSSIYHFSYMKLNIKLKATNKRDHLAFINLINNATLDDCYQYHCLAYLDSSFLLLIKHLIDSEPSSI